MKIVYLANLRLPTEKAYGIQIVKMCEAFALNGAEVSLIFPYRRNPNIKEDLLKYYSVRDNFKVKQLQARDFYWPGFLDKIAVSIKNFISARALVAEALKENADAYYTRDELVAYLLSKKDKKVVFECHRFSDKRGKFYSYFKKRSLKIVAISNGLKDDLVKFGIEESNILVAHDGVDLEEFSVETSKEEARKRFYSNIHDESFGRKKIAVYIGSLYSWKGGLKLFSDIAESLCEKNANYLVSFFGGTDKDTNGLKEELKKVSDKINPNLVPMVCVRGRVPHKEVPYILKAADCAILTGNKSDITSSKYTSPLKMFEYMASGCPIVAHDLPSFREVLNTNNSFLVEPGNAQAMAGTIDLVFKDEKLAKEKSDKALKDVQAYSWQTRAKNILLII